MAFILSQLIKRKLPEWNERVLSGDDLDKYVEAFRVPMIEDDAAKAKGEYLLIEGQPIIILKPNLKQMEKLWVGFHELGHHLLHYPVPHRFSKGCWRRKDREANFFAAIALLPTKLVESLTLAEIVEEYGYPN
jgi:Zn-dependent peptidase ImmA (M78 family)